MRSTIRLNFLESILVLLGLALFVSSAVIYFANFPLHKYLFYLSGRDNQETKLGSIVNQLGSLKRMPLHSFSFEPIGTGAEIHSRDTLVTGSGSSAIISLQDGNRVELGPDSMVQIDFRKEFNLNGVQSFDALRVAIGTARVKTYGAKLLLSDSQHNTYSIDAHTAQALSVTPSARKNVTHLTPPTQLSPQLSAKQDTAFELKAVYTPTPTPAVTVTSAPSPSPQPQPSQIPTIRPIPFSPVKLLTPLIGGESTTSNKLRGNLLSNFNILLHWEKYPGASSYLIWFGATREAKKPFFERKLTKTEYLFNQGTVFVGQFYYKVIALLPHGRIATSPLENFSFQFLAPTPTLPPMNYTISQAEIAANNNQLLLTWEKTNFTEKYEIEISTDPQFAKILMRRILAENYVFLSRFAAGSYWWRVRGNIKNIWSPMSKTARFSITP